MWDTIEHLENPKEFIKKIYNDLDLGGHLFITTGDAGSLLAKIRRENWRIIHPPTHIFYFSKKTITKLLEQCGFRVVKISHPGVYRSLSQTYYSLFLLKRSGGQMKVEKIKKIDMPVYFNTYDIMMIAAKKI